MITPKCVVDARRVYSQQRKCYAEEIVHQKRVVVRFRSARERVIQGRQRHAYLEK